MNVADPLYIESESIFQAIKKYAPRLKGKLLDVDCGNKPYEKLFCVSEYIGLDLERKVFERNNKVDLLASATNIPFAAKSFYTVYILNKIGIIFDKLDTKRYDTSGYVCLAKKR